MLILVSGPPAAWKTRLAREISKAIGCPLICRDDIKAGLVHANGGGKPEGVDASGAIFHATSTICGRRPCAGAGIG